MALDNGGCSPQQANTQGGLINQLGGQLGGLNGNWPYAGTFGSQVCPTCHTCPTCGRKQ